MPTQSRPAAVLDGTTDPLTKARLLAAVLGRPMSGAELDRRTRTAGVADAVDELVLSGSVRRTPDGGLELDPRRRTAALDALARDLGAGDAPARRPRT
ncbi:hypothetical protein MHY85_12110 [Cellulomonas sp. ACRRI]|uniref:hypothetical protein n=1 Tax=Cellulomonas sp. ACRRI TaxID=2918188 RepID=UPI001EF3B618|nr:hypothetical protein [Cellulomonas sp. ACRRI]MCG7286712.1 hypothetical protein [Cellulomonas sp. ACRRI]